MASPVLPSRGPEPPEPPLEPPEPPPEPPDAEAPPVPVPPLPPVAPLDPAVPPLVPTAENPPDAEPIAPPFPELAPEPLLPALPSGSSAFDPQPTYTPTTTNDKKSSSRPMLQMFGQWAASGKHRSTASPRKSTVRSADFRCRK